MSERRKRRCLNRAQGGYKLGFGAYLNLLPKEPFRVFFPLGVVAGVVGVSLWPLFYARALVMYPAVAHSRMMICGFVAAFAIGFLGTAVPKMLDAPRLIPGELLALIVLYCASVSAFLAGATIAGDTLFLGLLLAFALVLGMRFVKGR